MTKPRPGYPSTPSQIATAERRGWHQKSRGSWVPPKNFGDADADRIAQAEARRARRQVGAD